MAASTVLELHLSGWQCLACHERQGQGGPDPERALRLRGDELLGDAGRFPPPLTGAGAKLRVDWMERLLRGEERERPFLSLRMPKFPETVAQRLPALFAVVDLPPKKRESWTWQGADLDAGRVLVGTQGGMGCVSCHGWKDREGLTMNAVELSGMAERLHPEWVCECLLDPAKFRPGILMPSFWPEGRSSHPGVLDGDTDRQLAAIWRYLTEGDREPEGYPPVDRREFELIPQDRVVVQRGFISPAGTHAVAVGFPGGPHYVFDAERCRTAALWRGRFLDAYGLWFSRLQPTAAPLSDVVWILPEEGLLDWSGREEGAVRFEGYTLQGAQGTPEFLYRIGSVEIGERWEAQSDGAGMIRRLRLRNHGETIRGSVTLQPPAPQGCAITGERTARTWELQPGEERVFTWHYQWEDGKEAAR